MSIGSLCSLSKNEMMNIILWFFPLIVSVVEIGGF